MRIVVELRRRARQVAPQVLAACTVAYFAYHAVQGDRGLLAYLRLTQEVRVAEQMAEQTAERRAALERRVALLRPEALDADMLEERARALLNYGRPGDLLIFLPKDENAPTAR